MQRCNRRSKKGNISPPTQEPEGPKVLCHYIRALARSALTCPLGVGCWARFHRGLWSHHQTAPPTEQQIDYSPRECFDLCSRWLVRHKEAEQRKWNFCIYTSRLSRPVCERCFQSFAQHRRQEVLREFPFWCAFALDRRVGLI